MTVVVEQGPPARGAGEGRERSSSGAVDVGQNRTSNNEEGSEEQDEHAPAAEEEMDDDNEEEGDTDQGENSGHGGPLTTLETTSSDRGTTSVTATAPADSSTSSRPRSAPATESTDETPSSPVVHTRARSDASSATNVPDSGEDDVSKRLCSSHPPAGPLLEDIELVNLHNLSLHKLEGMERLVFVRVADLSGNELHDTLPLRSCVCLEVCLMHDAQACLPRNSHDLQGVLL